MVILVTGNLGCLTGTLARQFSKEKIKMVIAGPYAGDLNIQLPGITAYSVQLYGSAFRELMLAFKFDAVIYLAAREESLLADEPGNTGNRAEGLQSTLELSKAAGVQKFFFVSSSEIYGEQEDTDEAAIAQPASPNGYLLASEEQCCQYYSRKYGLNVTVVRVPFLYDPEEKAGLLHHILQDCQADGRVTLPGAEETVMSFLPAVSVADFLLRALDVDAPGWRVVNLCPAHPISLRELGGLLAEQFPELAVSFDAAQRIYTRAVTLSNAKRYYDWLPIDQLAADLPALREALQPAARRRTEPLDWLKGKFPAYPLYLKWTEVFLGALAMMWLTNLTGSFVEFRYVDFRLMYVILIGTTYGTQAGLVASLLACLSVILGARRLGLEWTELAYNVANWLPFAVYLTAGALTGYLQNKRENEANFQSEQNRLISEKYEYLYGVHQDVVKIKDQYYQQLLGSRDSFGRIFNITRQLDTLEEDEVLFRAVTILEDVMGTSSVAIYSLNSSNHFARLEMSSSALADRISRSLDLETFPELQACIYKAEIYENRRLLPDYPAYFAPIISGEKPVAGIAIWEARFEQGSLYYYNLFKVICGLIQSSVHRAIVFLTAAQDKLCVPGTRILKPGPFKRILRVRDNMKKRKIGNYLLGMVSTNGPDRSQPNWIGLEHLLSGVIRTADDIGLLDDGNLYVVFSQTDERQALALNNRFSQSGLCLEPVMVSLDTLLEDIASAAVTGQPDELQAQGELYE